MVDTSRVFQSGSKLGIGVTGGLKVDGGLSHEKSTACLRGK